MFSDKDKQEWQKIKARDTLLLEIETELEKREDTVNKKLSFKGVSLPLIAASLLIVFLSVLIIGNNDNISISVDSIVLSEKNVQFDLDEGAMLLSRSIKEFDTVNVFLDIKKNTVLKTSDGYFEIFDENKEIIFSGNEYTTENDTEIFWHYPIIQAQENVKLYLIGASGEYEINLTHNIETHTREISCIRK